MARLARPVISDIPYDVTQRGSGGRRGFFSQADFAAYRDLLAGAAARRLPFWSGPGGFRWWFLVTHANIRISSVLRL
jgi:hypothetical protein